MPICFDSFEVDTTNGRLLKFGVRVPLREQAFQVLLALLDRPGELVTREELRQRLWADATHVDFEAGLNTAMSRLRSALGDPADAPRCIETIPKRGYRLIANLPRQSTVAVMPFDHPAEMKPSAEMLTEALNRVLGRMEGVRVASRSAAARFEGGPSDPQVAAKALGVAFLVEGSVREISGQVHVHVQLVDGRDGFILWADSYHGERTHLAALQESVSAGLSAALRQRITPAEPSARTPNLPAYAAYLRGHFLVARLSLAKALDYFEKAIRSDPNYALAYHGAAVVHIMRALIGQQDPQQDLPVAESCLLQGHRLAPDSSPILHTLGMLRMFQWRWEEAEAAYLQAIAAQPDNAYAHMMFALHHSFRDEPALALRHAQTALELQPLDPMTNFRLVQCLYYARDYHGAVAAAVSALELAPGNAAAHWYLGWALLELGRMEEAWLAALKARQLERHSPLCAAQAAYVAGRVGRQAEARAILDELRQRQQPGQYCPALAVAWVHLGLGEKREALAWLARALRQRDPYLAAVRVFPGYDCLRSHRPFRTIIESVSGPVARKVVAPGDGDSQATEAISRTSHLPMLLTERQR